MKLKTGRKRVLTTMRESICHVRTELRKNKGAALPFTIAFTFVFAAVGVCLWFVSLIIGGGREVQHATDSGNLNVAKQAISSPNVDLMNGVEANLFADLVDPANGKVDLARYDEIVARAALIWLNADAEGTAKAKQNARLAAKAANDIGSRLGQRLRNAALVDPPFGNCASANSCRMLGAGSTVRSTGTDFAVSYMERPDGKPGIGASNVSIDPNQYPTDDKGRKHKFAQSSLTSFDNKTYLVGYRNFVIENSSSVVPLAAVPMQPGSQPHLVSSTNFSSNSAQPKLSGGAPAIPNAFKSGGVAQKTKVPVRAVSCAIVGSIGRGVSVSFPKGYIMVYNPKGLGGHMTHTTVENVFNNELMNGGIYFAQPNLALSTDYDALKRWADYNDAIAKGMPVGNPPSAQGIFDSSGRAATTATLSQITAVDPAPCLNTSVSGTGARAECASLAKGAFQTAYPASLTVPGNESQIMGVEKFKLDVINAYFSSWCIDGGCRTVTVNPSITGLRHFDHNTVYQVGTAGNPMHPVKPLPGTTIFSVPGTVAELLNQVGNGAPKFIARLKERLHQIDPSAKDALMNELLGVVQGPRTHRIELDEISYLYKGPSGLVFTEVPPPGVTPPNPRQFANPLRLLFDDSVLDGPIERCYSQYSTINKTVNPPRELNVHDQLWMQMPASPGPGIPAPAADAVGLAVDSVYYRPSTGFPAVDRSNLLGLLEFTNQASGEVTACAPN